MRLTVQTKRYSCHRLSTSWPLPATSSVLVVHTCGTTVLISLRPNMFQSYLSRRLLYCNPVAVHWASSRLIAGPDLSGYICMRDTVPATFFLGLPMNTLYTMLATTVAETAAMAAATNRPSMFG